MRVAWDDQTQYQDSPAETQTPGRDQPSQFGGDFNAMWGNPQQQPPAVQQPPAYQPPPEQQSPWGNQPFIRDIGGATNAGAGQQSVPGRDQPSQQQSVPPQDQYTSQIAQLQQQLQQLQQQLQQYQGGNQQQPPPPQQPPYPDNYNMFNPSGGQGQMHIQPYPYQGGGTRPGWGYPGGQYNSGYPGQQGGYYGGQVGPGGRVGGGRVGGGPLTAPIGDQQGTGGYGQPSQPPQQDQSPMSYQPPPWATSVLNNQRLPSFVGLGDYAPQPSPQVWGGMSPLEKQAVMQIAQTQGLDPASYLQSLQNSWPDQNWNFRGPANYRG